jgi:hypothetical protein
VRAAAGVDGRRLFAINRRDVAARVSALPDVRWVEVSARMPNRVRIVIEETRPVLSWTSAKAAEPGTPVTPLVLDERGRALANADAAGLPNVLDAAGLIRAPGDQIPPEVLSAALGYVGRFGGLSYHAAEGFVSDSPGGWEILLGHDPANASRQSQLLGELSAHLQPIEGAVAMVDLRFERPYYRLHTR